MNPEQAFNLIGQLYEQQSNLSPQQVRSLDQAFMVLAKALGLKTGLVQSNKEDLKHEDIIKPVSVQ